MLQFASVHFVLIYTFYIIIKKDLRTDADMSQRELSEILHISQRSYSHYETGSRNIPIEMLIRLANYYEISLDYLVGRTDNKKMAK